MSIVPCTAKIPKVCRTLMCSAPRGLRPIKVLADLENGEKHVFL